MVNVTFLLFGILVFAHGSVSECNQEDQKNEHHKYVNFGEIPFQVLLLSKSQHIFCGGAIINEKWVVTAANCIKGASISDLEAITGTIDIKNPQQKSKVKNIVIHEKYDRDGLKNDIALVEVTSPLTFSDTVKPVSLPLAHANVPANSTAVFSGYGAFSRDCQTELLNCHRLQKAEFYIYDQNECHEKYGRSWDITDTFICATDPFMKPYECGWGEPGGPLTVNGKLIGIMSWPFKGCDYYYPYVYTRVPEYIEWINDNIK